MKTMTNNLKLFCCLALAYSVIFFYYLYADLSTYSYNNIWIYAILYGSALFFSGLILGYHDSVRSSRLDLGFQYHLMTFIVVNFIGLISIFIAMGVNANTLLYAIPSIALWAMGLLVHYYYSYKSIKGIDKENIFE